jgi:hypothetical protein
MKMKRYPVTIDGQKYWSHYGHIAVRDDGVPVIITTKCKLVFSKFAVPYKNKQGMPRYTVFTIQQFVDLNNVKLFGKHSPDDIVVARRVKKCRRIALQELGDNGTETYAPQVCSDSDILQYDMGVVRANKLLRKASKEDTFSTYLNKEGTASAVIVGKLYSFTWYDKTGEFSIVFEYNGKMVNTPKYKIMQKKMQNRYGEECHADDIHIPSWGLC